MRSKLMFLVVMAAACSDDVGLPDARQPIDAAVAGNLMVSWTLGHAGTPLTCAQIAASSVTVEMVKSGSKAGSVDSFSCTSASGTTTDLTPGRYDVTLTLTGSGGTLGTPIQTLGVEVRSGQTTTIEPAAFDVDPSGTLVFRLSADAGSGVDNCGPAPGGAAIDAFRLELRDAAGTCVPTTFAISAGASLPAGSYASDCATASYGCIAADQDLTATAVASGQHSMVINGLVGANACWRRTSSFVVRASGLTTTLNPQVLTRDTVLCP